MKFSKIFIIIKQKKPNKTDKTVCDIELAKNIVSKHSTLNPSVYLIFLTVCISYAKSKKRGGFINKSFISKQKREKIQIPILISIKIRYHRRYLQKYFKKLVRDSFLIKFLKFFINIVIRNR